MRKNVLLSLGAVSVLFGALLLQPQRAAADPATDSINAVQVLDPSLNPIGDPVGSCRLTREDTGIRFQFSTSKLVPLNVYSLWVVLYGADGSMRYVAYGGGGGIALPDGTCSFSGHLPVGAMGAVNGKTIIVSDGAMFDNPRTVKVGVVIRAHGAIVLDQLADQLTTFNGACPPNTCLNYQGSFHTP